MLGIQKIAHRLFRDEIDHTVDPLIWNGERPTSDREFLTACVLARFINKLSDKCKEAPTLYYVVDRLTEELEEIKEKRFASSTSK